MKLAREFAILFFGCAACAEASSRAAAGAAVTLPALDVPVASAFDSDDSDDLPVPADVDDGEEYRDDDAQEDAGSDDTGDDVQVTYKRVAQHVRLVDDQSLPDQSPPVVMMNSNDDGDAASINFVAGGNAASSDTDVDDDEALLYSEVPVEALPRESQEAARAAFVPFPQPEAPQELAHVAFVPPPQLEVPAAYTKEKVRDYARAPLPFDPAAARPASEAELGDFEGEDGGGAEQEDDGSESDSYTMMMYLKGRAASVEKENQRMKDMLSQAAAWGKGVQKTAANLDAERKETAALKGQLRGYQAAKEKIAQEVQAERAQEKDAESKVKALQYVHEQLLGTQSDNAQLQRQLDNATHVGEDLRLQLVASERGVQVAEKSESAVAEQTKSEEEWLDEEAKKLDNIKVVKRKEDAELKVAQNSSKTAKKLQQVVNQRDELLRKGLKQLLTEKEHQQELQRQLDSQDAEFTGAIAAERANATSALGKLLASKSKVKELKRAVAMTWRMAAAGDRARQEVDRSMTQAKAELKRVKKGDEEVQAHTEVLKHHIKAEKKALQNATESEQLADEARDAAQAEVASAKGEIEKLEQQDESVAQENRDLRTSLKQTKAAESQLLRDAMGSVSEAGGLDIENLSRPAAKKNATSFVAVAAETSPADLPTLDVVPP